MQRDPAKRLALYKQGRQSWSDASPVVFLMWGVSDWLISPHIQGMREHISPADRSFPGDRFIEQLDISRSATEVAAAARPGDPSRRGEAPSSNTCRRGPGARSPARTFRKSEVRSDARGRTGPAEGPPDAAPAAPAAPSPSSSPTCRAARSCGSTSAPGWSRPMRGTRPSCAKRLPSTGAGPTNRSAMPFRPPSPRRARPWPPPSPPSAPSPSSPGAPRPAHRPHGPAHRHRHGTRRRLRRPPAQPRRSPAERRPRRPDPADRA